MVFLLLIWAKSFFDLLVVPLSYSFEGYFKNTYPPTILEFRPLEVTRPSFWAFEPSLTYTLIEPCCKLMLKTLLITFFELLFLKNCVMLNIVPYTGLFYGVHSFFNYQHGWHVEGSPLLNQFWTQGKVTP